MTQIGVSSTRLRILIVDRHEVSRAAISALLRTEGLEVIADVPTGELAIERGRGLYPDVAIVDASDGVSPAIEIACALEQLPSLPTVVLTSSNTPNEHIDGYAFIPKADLCATRLRRALHPPDHDE